MVAASQDVWFPHRGWNTQEWNSPVRCVAWNLIRPAGDGSCVLSQTRCCEESDSAYGRSSNRRCSFFPATFVAPPRIESVPDQTQVSSFSVSLVVVLLVKLSLYLILKLRVEPTVSLLYFPVLLHTNTVRAFYCPAAGFCTNRGSESKEL